MFGVEDPFFRFNSSSSNFDEGGVLSFKVKLLSVKIEISTGTIPLKFFVKRLYSEQNWTKFKPYWPKIGPTGGAAVAFPAAKDILRIDFNFLITYLEKGILSKKKLS